MRLNSKIFFTSAFLAIAFSAPTHAAPAKNDPVVEVGFADIALSDFVKTVSKITGKNILIATELQGKVDFVAQRPLRKSELYDLLINTLETKGYTIVSSDKGYLKVVALSDAVRHNLPLNESSQIPQMRTKVIKLSNLKAAEAQNTVRHLLSKSGALQPSMESNDLIISDFPKNVETISKIIAQMERDSEKKAYVTAVIILKNGDSENISKALNELLSKKTVIKDAPKPVISPDAHTNSLIVISTSEELTEIKNIIKALDVERQQVYVRAKIVELNNEKTRQVGVKYGIQGATASSSGLYSFSALLGGTPIAIGQEILKYISISNIKEGLALGATIALLGEEKAANLLSEPSILCINNQESSIYVGKTVPIVTQSTINATTIDLAKNSYTRQDIGLLLKIKPRLSNDGKVALAIETKLEDTFSQDIVGLPITTKRELKTTAILSNGEPVIIGGLIKDDDKSGLSKVPFLGDLPIVGNLFKYDQSSKDKINLVVILTPYIVDKSSDLATLRAKLGELDSLQSEYSKKIQSKKIAEE